MFKDDSEDRPDDPMTLGKWLRPSIDVGPAMTAKILKENGEVMHQSTDHELTPEEWASEDEKKMRERFLKIVL